MDNEYPKKKRDKQAIENQRGQPNYKAIGTMAPGQSACK